MSGLNLRADVCLTSRHVVLLMCGCNEELSRRARRSFKHPERGLPLIMMLIDTSAIWHCLLLLLQHDEAPKPTPCR